MEPALIQHLLIALGLGLLVGLERERSHSRIAGIRTFPLITLTGALAALLAQRHGGWVLAAAWLAVAAMVVLGSRAEQAMRARQGEADPGLTTELAMLLMFGVGAAPAAGYTAGAVVVGGGVATLLHWKQPLHRTVERIGPDDARLIFRFVLIALVILPLLPNRTFGPYDVLNPFKIWLMVVLILGISASAYVASRLLGPRGGTLAAGLLGGLISSTATTVTYSGRSRSQPQRAGAAATVILLASTVVFGRVLIEIAVVAPDMLRTAAPPLALMAGLMLVLSLGMFARDQRRWTDTEEQEAPSDLKTAITFGLLYAAILFAVAAAKEHFGQTALYLVAGLSGLTDMDAITLSTAQLVGAGKLEADTGWRLILVGSLANLLFKGAVVAALGHRRLLLRIALLFGIALAGGGLMLALWP